jgi:hypothetical protein
MVLGKEQRKGRAFGLKALPFIRRMKYENTLDCLLTSQQGEYCNDLLKCQYYIWKNAGIPEKNEDYKSHSYVIKPVLK